MIGSDHNQSKSVTDSSEREPERVSAMAAVAQISEICVKAPKDSLSCCALSHHYQQKKRAERAKSAAGKQKRSFIIEIKIK